MNDMQLKVLLTCHSLEMTNGQYRQALYLDCQDVINCPFDYIAW